jgi:hypothetical protein
MDNSVLGSKRVWSVFPYFFMCSGSINEYAGSAGVFGSFLGATGATFGALISIVVVELLDPTPQERPRFLASTEYLIHGDRSPHMRFSFFKRVPRWHTKSSEQALMLFNEQTDEVLVVELVDPTPQERPRFLASTEYLMC